MTKKKITYVVQQVFKDNEGRLHNDKDAALFLVPKGLIMEQVTRWETNDLTIEDYLNGTIGFKVYYHHGDIVPPSILCKERSLPLDYLDVLYNHKEKLTQDYVNSIENQVYKSIAQDILQNKEKVS